VIQNELNRMFFVKYSPMDSHFVCQFKRHLNHLLINGSKRIFE
jgi:hypothetical protein